MNRTPHRALHRDGSPSPLHVGGSREAAAGFSLLEVSIGSSLLAVLLLVSLMIMGAAQRGYSYSRARTHLDDQARIVLKEITRELACTGIICPGWSISSTKVTYRRCDGYDFGADNPGWGNLRTVELTGSKVVFSETDSGGNPVFTRTLVEDVQSFSISQDVNDPDLITISLGLEGTDSQGVAIPINKTSVVFLRN